MDEPGANSPAEPDPDRFLRRALAPDDETVDRVVRRALAPLRRRTAFRLRTGALAAASLLVVLGLVLWLGTAPPEESQAPPVVATTEPADATDEAATEAAEPSSLRITNLDGPLTVSTDAGTRWIVLDDT